MMEKLIHILKKHDAKKIEIFGSYARGEQKETSDLDVIVEFEKRKSLLELVGDGSYPPGIKVTLLSDRQNSISPSSKAEGCNISIFSSSPKHQAALASPSPTSLSNTSDHLRTSLHPAICTGLLPLLFPLGKM